MTKTVLHAPGERFGKLIVIEQAQSVRGAMWRCRCDCGNEIVVTGRNLRSGNTTSCHCVRDTQGGFTEKHRHWKRWCAILERCNSPTCPAYPNYGGRGIKVCERWKHFPNFVADMDATYFDGASLDRIDNDGDYEPSNCRWATQQQQMRNTRKNVLIEYAGERLPIASWSERYGLPRKAVEQRLRKGWTVPAAFTTPLIPRGLRTKGHP